MSGFTEGNASIPMPWKDAPFLVSNVLLIAGVWMYYTVEDPLAPWFPFTAVSMAILIPPMFWGNRRKSGWRAYYWVYLILCFVLGMSGTYHSVSVHESKMPIVPVQNSDR